MPGGQAAFGAPDASGDISFLKGAPPRAPRRRSSVFRHHKKNPRTSELDPKRPVRLKRPVPLPLRPPTCAVLRQSVRVSMSGVGSVGAGLLQR